MQTKNSHDLSRSAETENMYQYTPDHAQAQAMTPDKLSTETVVGERIIVKSKLQFGLFGTHRDTKMQIKPIFTGVKPLIST